MQRVKPDAQHLLAPVLDPPAQRHASRTRSIFRMMVALQVAVNIEAGALPCLLNDMTKKFGLSAMQQGGLGGIVYFALSVACPLAGYLFHRHSPRVVIACTLVLNCLATIAFGLVPTDMPNVLIAVRSVIGFSQAFLMVYNPVWVEENAPASSRTSWMSFLQASVPIGIMLGYLLAMISLAVGGWRFLAVLDAWRYPFVLQGAAVLPFAILVFFTRDLASGSPASGPDDAPARKGLGAELASPTRYSERADAQHQHDNASVRSRSRTLAAVRLDFSPGAPESPPVLRPRNNTALGLASMLLGSAPRTVLRRRQNTLIDAFARPAAMAAAFITHAAEPRGHGDDSSSHGGGGGGPPARGRRNSNETAASRGNTRRSGGGSGGRRAPSTGHASRVDHAFGRLAAAIPFLSPSQRQRSRSVGLAAWASPPPPARHRAGTTEDGDVAAVSATVGELGGQARASRVSTNASARSSGGGGSGSGSGSGSDAVERHLRLRHADAGAGAAVSRTEVRSRRRAQTSEHASPPRPARSGRHSPESPAAPDAGDEGDASPRAGADAGAAAGGDEPPRATRATERGQTAGAVVLADASSERDSGSASSDAGPAAVAAQRDELEAFLSGGEEDEDGDQVGARPRHKQAAAEAAEAEAEGEEAADNDVDFARNGAAHGAASAARPDAVGHAAHDSDDDDDDDDDAGDQWEDDSEAEVEARVRCAPCELHELRALLSTPEYTLIVLALSALYYVVSGVSFWASTFMIDVVHGDRFLIMSLFVFTSATAPVAGVFFGGYVIDGIGGYSASDAQRVRALEYICVLGTLAALSGVLATALLRLAWVVTCLWMLLFFGGSVVPPCTGIFIQVVRADMRAYASSISVLAFNVLGYAMSPLVSGWVQGATGSELWGFRAVLYVGALAWAALLAVMMAGRRKLRDGARAYEGLGGQVSSV